MDAYDYCKTLVEKWPNRWTGSVGERESGDWMEQELARMGYATRQHRFDCPGWEYAGDEFFLDGHPVAAGAQFFSLGCDVQAPLAPVQPDGRGGFSGTAKGKIALLRETDTKDVNDRNQLIDSLASAGARGVVIVSEYQDTYSTKMFRDPEGRLPVAGVSGVVGEQLYAAAGKELKMLIHARRTRSSTANILGEKGPVGGPAFMVCAHHEASPASPGAADNASGVGVVLAIAKAFAKTKVNARLQFVGFGGHEFGAIGSHRYVQDFPAEARRTRRLLVFDVVGIKGQTPGLVFAGDARMAASLEAFARTIPGLSGSVRERSPGGDAGAFVEVGVGAVWVSSSGGRAAPASAPLNQIRATGDGANNVVLSQITRFHSPIDDMRWIGREEMARHVVAGVALLKHWLAE